MKVQDSLKPFVLSKENSVLEFSQWKKEFRAFYSASKLEKLDIVGQQAFFRKYLESNLLSVLETKISTTTTIFDDENAPGTDSCFLILEEEFKLRYPLVARRFQLFSIKQAQGETFTEYMAKIKTMATHCGLETLGIEGLLIYISIVGLNSTDFDLRKKLLELPTLTMKEVDRISRGYESAQSAIKSLSGIQAGFSSTVHRIRTFDNKNTDRQSDFKDYNFDKVKGRTPSERLKLLKESGWCMRCGRHPYDKYQKCWAASAQCYVCQDFGHLSYLCDQLENQSDESSGTSDPEESTSGSDEENQSQTRAVFST